MYAMLFFWYFCYNKCEKIDFIYAFIYLQATKQSSNTRQMAETEIRELSNLRAELSTLKKQMTAVQQRIKQMEHEVYNKCNHDWTIDRTNVGEHTEHVCVHCNMSKAL